MESERTSGVKNDPHTRGVEGGRDEERKLKRKSFDTKQIAVFRLKQNVLKNDYNQNSHQFICNLPIFLLYLHGRSLFSSFYASCL